MILTPMGAGRVRRTLFFQKGDSMVPEDGLSRLARVSFFTGAHEEV